MSQIGYEYHPEYAGSFPPVEHWMQLVDYNNDGREDVFTYTTGGIKVYRNDSQDMPAFTLVSGPYLVSLQGTTLTNIFVTYVDYPAIVDVDNDGDKDILTFWGLGSFIEWHKNLSMEYYGNADSLEFEKVSDCWGYFAEGAENNSIKLDTCPEYATGHGMIPSLKSSDPKHTGSTLLVLDFNGDGLYDLALGDVDYSTLLLLTNGGTAQDANMVSFSSSFPQAADPVNIVSFPACSATDVNNDGRIDLIASPFEPSLIRSDGMNSCRLYLDTGNNAAPQYSLKQNDFLQDEMIDLGLGAYPLFFDYNADGLNDLIVGNYGYLDSSYYDPLHGLTCEYISSLALFENTGTANVPVYKLLTRDYLGISALKMQSLIPAAGDVDGDGVTDLLCGNSKGKMVYVHNRAGAG
ncbi:MAG TPA: VCBS repeat-containing protein, partial [Bacteroidales bacterium]|nr:VCBS repeat-containing protein [Bacteroidales bacterium]